MFRSPIRRLLFPLAIAALALHDPAGTRRAAAGEPIPGLDDIVPALLPAVVNVSSIRFLPVPDGRSGEVAATTPRSSQLLGSGFIIDPSGVIVTNQHVIEDADEITVTLQDNTALKAQLLGASAIADIAVLKVDAAKKLPTVTFGDSRKVRVGEPVLAIGNPLGLGGSVSAGIVSALNRDIMKSPYDDYIQTDAAINHGNSGGPLFNLKGQVIGINTALYAPAGQTGSIGLGFAIPSNDANFVVRQLRANGRVRAGFMGVNIQRVTQDIAAAVGLSEIKGALVVDAVPGGPADLAGLRYGDVILKAGDTALPDPRAVARAVSQTPIGQTVSLTVWRDGALRIIPVTVGEWHGDQGAATPAAPAHGARSDAPDLGLRLSAITDEFASATSLQPTSTALS